MKYSELKKQIKKIILEELSYNNPEYIIQQFIDNKVEDLEWNGLEKFENFNLGNLQCQFVIQDTPYSIRGDVEIDLKNGEFIRKVVFNLYLFNDDTQKKYQIPDNLYKKVSEKFFDTIQDYISF